MSGALRPEPAMSEKLTDIGTRRIFNEDYDLVRETARKFFAQHVVPFHDQ
jgi:long-chain-acyl-CoA dehydrogenase